MLDKAFDPAAAEPRLYEAWETSGAFKPSGAPGAKPYTIVIPPPNVTGSLHMGHALNNTLQDALIRFERMRGKSVLWQPGMDHAGIATQMVVERQLAERQQKRTDFTRAEFVDLVWKWKAESGGTILNQLKRLGATCDWSRERFTMDDGLSKAVVKVFVQLYGEGLLYRDKRLVNWDPKLLTAISDLEVENIEVDGHFWHFKYPLENGETYEFPVAFDDNGEPTAWETRDFIAIATTRPETMLGDGAVAVHPSDKRYAPIVGKKVLLPLADRYIPVITDDYPDPDFGSGAVKITGAHDFNDYEVARRNDLPLYVIMDEHGRMLASDIMPAKYVGMDRFEARKHVVADIEARGLLLKVEDKKITQPFGDRSGVVIEPMLTDQWYVNAEELAKPAIAAVESGATRITPEAWEKTFFQWMRNIQPWCVSRQLWWGHQIPAWYGPSLEEFAKLGDIEQGEQFYYYSKVFVAESEDVVVKLAKEYYGDQCEITFSLDAGSRNPNPASLEDSVIFCGAAYAVEGRAATVTLRRDPDVLDTWFSSALWPFSTLGWPEEDSPLPRAGEGQGVRGKGAAALAPDPSPVNGRGETSPSVLAKHYPTSVLVTAFDIIFFWVARMMMMGLHFMKDKQGRGIVPFKDVYIHALVLDENGQKMSKSKGNVIDPLLLIDKYGADALRFTLAAQAAQGRNIRLSEARVEGYRNFGTKLWNAARFCEMNECFQDPAFDPASVKDALNQWIVHEANQCIAEVTAGLESYRFNDAAGALYKFTWSVFCDWYVELAKPALYDGEDALKAETRKTAAWALDQILKLLHPFMPFITEALWSRTERTTMLITADWPKEDARLRNPDAAAELNWVIGLISSIRSVRAEMNVPAGAKVPFVAVAIAATDKARFARREEIVARLARLSGISHASEAPKGAVQIVYEGAVFAIPLAGVIDIAAEKSRLEKELAKAADEIARIDKKLGNESFVARAPAEVVEEQRARRADYDAQHEKFAGALVRLSELDLQD